VATLGRLDVLRESGQLDALLASCARFAEHSAVLSAQRQGRASEAVGRSIAELREIVSSLKALFLAFCT